LPARATEEDSVTFADRRRDPALLEALCRIAPGTELRAGIDDIIKGHLGALIVIGEPRTLQFLFSGGVRVDVPFSAQFLFEFAKMDGAIILNPDASRLVYANVQLMPDATIPSRETGTRHRTAERVACQTAALVLSISQQRDTVTLYSGQLRYQLERVPDVLAATNQAVATLETYRKRLDEVASRLTALEFQNAVMLDDVLVVLQRAELTSRMGAEIERNVVELGDNGRLIAMQLAELIRDVPGDLAALVHDYQAGGSDAEVEDALRRLAELPHERLELRELAAVLGYPGVASAIDTPVVSRGWRVLGHVPRLPRSLVAGVAGSFDSLDSIVRATLRDLEAVDGVGATRAKEIRDGLRRLQEQNLHERYLTA
jgi:diadenylate cyclase